MNFMGAYNQAKNGKEVMWININDGKKHKTIWDNNYEKLLWKMPCDSDGELVTLNCNTINGWEIVEKKKTLYDKRCLSVVKNYSLYLEIKNVKEALKEYIDWVIWGYDKSDFNPHLIKEKARDIFGKELMGDK